MNLVKARLVKIRTDDGLVEFHESTPIGKEYTVDLDSVRTRRMWNTDHDCEHEKVIVSAVGGRWLPLECLELID